MLGSDIDRIVYTGITKNKHHYIRGTILKYNQTQSEFLGYYPWFRNTVNQLGQIELCFAHLSVLFV